MDKQDKIDFLEEAARHIYSALGSLDGTESEPDFEPLREALNHTAQVVEHYANSIYEE